MVVQGVPKHAHCEICGDVVKVGERWCSKACEERHEELQAEKKKSMWKFIALIVALMVFFTAIRYL